MKPKRKLTLRQKFIVWFRLKGYPFISFTYQAPAWWAWIMCKIGRHNWDLGWMGPEGCGLDCCDCGLYREITKKGVKDTYYK